MKISIMQPYLFPYWGYFQLIACSDRFITFDHVDYIVKGWINRNYIISNNNKLLITFPIIQAGINRSISELVFDLNSKWKEKFLKTIHHSYRRAPYFETTYSLLEKIVQFEDHRVSQYIYSSLVEILTYLGIESKLHSSLELNYRNIASGEEKILHICKYHQATTYINMAGGIHLYNPLTFERNKMQLYSLSANLFEYKVENREFIPALSIIDLLMNVDLATLQSQLNNFHLSHIKSQNEVSLEASF